MTIEEFSEQIVRRLGVSPTDQQREALSVFGHFLAYTGPSAMIMSGSAGTGKTTLAAAMMQTMYALGQKMQLMAPTGRAAKVLAVKCGMKAGTIHRKIYRRRSITGAFDLNDNLHRNTLFVVDEASMINQLPSKESVVFGNASLLDDLMAYVYSGQNCKLLLIGDKAQLPPIGETESGALTDYVLEGYGVRVYQSLLTEVVRQKAQSGILWNAGEIRKLITHDEMTALPCIRFDGFADIVRLTGGELLESLAESYRNVGEDETMVIVRSNKNANIYNNGIRTQILDKEEELTRGDRLMVVRNKYLTNNEELSFIANGDRAEVIRAGKFRELYGFHFANVELRFPDYDGYELTAIAMLDTLQSEAPALTNEQSQRLFEAIMEDYADMTRKSDKMTALKSNEYYNALQIKYAYAVTCHKAQGGQWQHVYVDQGYMTDEMLTPDYIHWLYTAFTRAKEKLFLVNWPKTQIKN